MINNNNNDTRPLKRKHMDNDHPQQQQKRKVRFDDHANQIHMTWSSEEYDRGGIFSFPVLYKVNPAILQQQTTPSPPKLSLDTTSLSNHDDDEDDHSPQTPSPTKQRPKLTINTTNLNGPHFLTRLSTSFPHEDKSNDYLVPLSASPSFLPLF